MCSHLNETSEQRKFLQNSVDHEKVALACLDVHKCAMHNHAHSLLPDNPCIPEELRSLGFKYIWVQEHSLRMEFHGGFDHYGFKLARDPGTPDKNQWILYYYTEDGSRELHRLVTD